MIAPLPVASPDPDDLLASYTDHVAGLAIGRGSRGARSRSARRFSAHHRDLGAWLLRPTLARVADLHRDGAWPFVVWAAVAGHLRVDAELLLTKPGGVDLAAVWDRFHPGEIARAEAVARELGWSANWTRQVARHTLPVVCTWAGKGLAALGEGDLADFRAELERTVYLSESARTRARTRALAVHQVCFQLRLVASPPGRGVAEPARTPAQLAALIPQPAIRREIIRYAETVGAVLRPASVHARIKALRVFFERLATTHPEVRRLDQLERAAHVEPFLAWARHRPWRGANGRGRTISLTQFHHDVVELRVFFEDIAAWGWAAAPRSRLLFLTDLPRLPEAMPRALTPAADTALMAAVECLEEPFARTGLIVLRATGIRVGELLDLELDCLLDFGRHGMWLRVPVGKLASERTVPLEPSTVEILDRWMAARGRQRPLPHPRDGRPAEFVFMARGRRLTEWWLRQGLDVAAAAAGLARPDGSPLHLTLHQLRHTFGTSLINAGMSLPALMALLGHVSPEMTLRYARLASPTIRAAYEAAMGKVTSRWHVPLAPADVPAIPDRVRWLEQEMLKTRVAHGYCSRHLAAGACSYANICETCEDFVSAPEFAPVLESQLIDVRALRDDAVQRGWETEIARHGRVVESLEEHLERLKEGGDPAEDG
ncbi:MAG: tyrosine-type recombinase/integrase [Thermoanaerobaculales bacterium]